MLLGYNTNGFAHHDLLEVIDVLAEIGYRSVALTLDHHTLNPFEDGLDKELDELQRRLKWHGFRSVIETGARFLLDPRLKHEPSLVSPSAWDRARRIEFLCRAIDIAKRLGSDCVSFWSGTVRDGAEDDEVWKRLVEGVQRTIHYAADHQVKLGFEPEPGMFIDTMTRYQELIDRVDAPHFLLTLDIGHLHCTGETPIADQIRRWSQRMINVHIEDMVAGVHEHRMFGEGEMDFRPIMQAFRDVGYQGALHVELSRHSHEAPTAAKKAWEFLSKMMS
jgi:L-ribulose-5-phosphate 3-epimerase